MSDFEISIVTGTRNRPASLKRFVDSVFATATVDTEVIIADASDHWDPPSGFCVPDRRRIEVTHFQESPRLGFVKGYNEAFREATGRYVLFANDDAELLPGWDKIAVDYLDKYPEIGCGCLYWWDPGGKPYLQTYQTIPYPNFGFIRRSVGEKIGWFDETPVFVPELNREESLEFYGCDTNLAFQIINAGFAVCGIPGCKIKHHREQDDERRHNNEKYIHGEPSRLPGRILWLKWNGDQEKASTLGYEYGWKMLREKYARFKHLEQPTQID